MPHVLVVDDDPVSRLVAEHILRTAGYEVTAAQSAREAQQHLASAERPVTIVVCDIHMPDQSGLDLLEAVLAVENDPPPFLLLTGVGDRDELDDDRTEGAAGFLTKPVRSDELLENVRAILDQKSQR